MAPNQNVWLARTEGSMKKTKGCDIVLGLRYGRLPCSPWQCSNTSNSVSADAQETICSA